MGGDRHARGEVAGGDAPGRFLGLANRAGQALAEAPGHQRADGQGADARDQEPADGGAQQRVDLAGDHHHGEGVLAPGQGQWRGRRGVDE